MVQDSENLTIGTFAKAAGVNVETISNYTNHLFNTPLNALFAAYALPEKS